MMSQRIIALALILFAALASAYQLMNAKRISFIFLVFTLLLAACQPARQATPVTFQSQPYYPELEASVSLQATAAPGQQSQLNPEGEPPADNFFQQYGVNPFVDTLEDHLSTFAVDVDTASYSVARRYVTDGYLPPAEAVRVEEFVNYFDYDYPSPAEKSFAVYAAGAPSPFHGDSTYLLRFAVQGYRVPEAERLPASLTFVIDVSGSMDMENRLGLVKRSLEMLVERLRPDDSVAIVVYGSTAYTVLEPSSGAEPGKILNAIYALHPEGSTNAEAGLRLGYQVAMQAFRSGGINRVILCSDGVANVGNTGPDAILKEIRGYVDEGIQMTTLGFGMGNFNDVLMERLANDGDGSYAYIDTLDEAQKLFVENLTSTLQVIALDAKIQVDFNPQVVSRYRLIGYENRNVADEDFRNDQVDAGEIGAGHSVTALYAVQLHPQTAGRLASLYLRWQNPDTREVQELSQDFTTLELSPAFEASSPDYQLAVVASQYAELLRQSPWAEGTTFSALSGQASRLGELLPEEADVSELIRLLNRAGELSR